MSRVATKERPRSARRRRTKKWKGQSICPILKTLGENNEETWEEESTGLWESLGSSLLPCPDDAWAKHLEAEKNAQAAVENSRADSCHNVELLKHRRSRPRLLTDEMGPPAPIGTIDEEEAEPPVRSDSLEDGSYVSKGDIMDCVSLALEPPEEFLNDTIKCPVVYSSFSETEDHSKCWTTIVGNPLLLYAVRPPQDGQT
eukprot:CAMPEP_0194571950 /NCGR_PEP_ID=MMETSP0292-20121207/8728_1 /TAXON_ID=39354 /ORGANISM="Heterosigma akashiwo, Strain CCMP2393" /LENGTH=199 /DNA_ID=CAMNT_0039422837 /DNA_START=63 /DNA_END=663 /DNA_ORIENTATION=-